MIFYLTYNEAPSGIFSSQVIDVVKFLDQNFKIKIKLLAFISVRRYFSNKKAIKLQLPGAIVLPMYPKMKNWRLNKFLLQFFCTAYKPTKIIARSVMATKLALMMRDKHKCKMVTYDGRGAIEAEWKEYQVITDTDLLDLIFNYEKEVILNSDFRIAVSNKLLDFWRKNFAYNQLNHVVIPCTLNSDFELVKINHKLIFEKRKELGLLETDCVFIYSGSVAGWQSFDLLHAVMEPILKNSITNKLVFFSPANNNIEEFKLRFPTQIICKQLTPNAVSNYLIVGDYGLLLRENTITNQVASPLKYAEYLACGLKVIVSDNLGDYTDLTLQKNWGYIYSQIKTSLLKPDIEEKQKISEAAIQFFSKKNYAQQYQQLL